MGTKARPSPNASDMRSRKRDDVRAMTGSSGRDNTTQATLADFNDGALQPSFNRLRRIRDQYGATRQRQERLGSRECTEGRPAEGHHASDPLTRAAPLGNRVPAENSVRTLVRQTLPLSPQRHIDRARQLPTARSNQPFAASRHHSCPRALSPRLRRGVRHSSRTSSGQFERTNPANWRGRHSPP